MKNSTTPSHFQAFSDCQSTSTHSTSTIDQPSVPRPIISDPTDIAPANASTAFSSGEAASCIRVGAVSYLNTKPLIFEFESFLKETAALSVDLPSRLADRMAADELDIALVPCIEYFRHPDWQIVSNACIGCFGPVWSVKVLFRCPPADVRTLSLDEGSRTSAALTQILLAERFDIRPETKILDMDENYEEVASDAVLVIGDRAMHDSMITIDNGFVAEWDLGQEWKDHTGLPFVFAMWVARRDISAAVVRGLESCRDAGLAAIEKLSEKHAADYHLTQLECQRYLGQHLNYHLDEASRQAMELYRKKASRLGLV
jgi:chorismate dehydratase